MSLKEITTNSHFVEKTNTLCILNRASIVVNHLIELICNNVDAEVCTHIRIVVFHEEIKTLEANHNDTSQPE